MRVNKERGERDVEQPVSMQGMIHAINGIYFTSIYVNLQADSYEALQVAPWMQSFLPNEGAYSSFVEALVHQTAPEAHQELLRRHLSVENIRALVNPEEGTADGPSFYMDYPVQGYDKMQEIRAVISLAAVDANGDPSEIMVLLQDRSLEKRQTMIDRWISSYAKDLENSMEGVIWKSLMNSKTINLFWKDKDRRFVGANQKFLDTYGFADASAIVGKTDEDMHWHVDDAPFQQDEWDIIHNGTVISNRQGKCLINGVVYDILANKEPLYRNGEIVGLFGYFVILEDIMKHCKNGSESSIENYVLDLLKIDDMLSLGQ